MNHRTTHGSKGDMPRKVDTATYGSNFDDIFRKKDETKTKHTNSDNTRTRRAIKGTKRKTS